jgi:isoleucyl-tRNA synthetase
MPANETATTDYRSTLNLPKTEFPMRAELPKREPERVAWWQQHRVYERRLAANAGHAPWTLHDGPPYANGEVHMGGFLNRVLKDIFVKVHLLDGAHAKFVPGWDMHGLPIESETLKHLKLDFHDVDPIELRARCRERALYWLDVQRETFLRMGTLGDFERPYRTIDKEFEAVIVETLGDLAEAGQLYKGLRSTLWCTHDETALAEAEIEYKDDVSPSIYVRFTANEAQKSDLLARTRVHAEHAHGPLSIMIWTTTPWTLPANVAIAVKPEASYGVYRRGSELILLADELADSVFSKADDGLEHVRVGGARGTALVGAAVRHPFLHRDSEVVSAEYVTLDSGTGAVHIAPGHGAEDFETGLRFGLPVINPVDARGYFTAEAGVYAGEQILEANERIAADLYTSGHLFEREGYRHSYPHCWRCKHPVIFRATSQWFVAMDVNRLRKRIEEKIPSVHWHPEWGEHRMLQMIEDHPEWCISRQRTWGTPIPALVCTNCGTSFIDPDVAKRVAALFRERGTDEANASDLWWTEPLRTFLPENVRCPKCNGIALDKEYNIVDIWFESGVTHRAVLRQRGLTWPADLYLEGADQYRGWFRSNLITAVATAGAPPYREVVSTGWVLDEQGRAMHKSVGNYIGALEAMQTYGADVLRLWVASVEFTADMRIGEHLLESVGSVYRNLRYRLRMLLGLLDDFQPEDIVPPERLEPVDRLALAKLDDLCHRVVQDYKHYLLHDVYLALLDYDAADLSRFYIDLLKDPMYSGPREGARRRSAQTALLAIFEALCGLLAPLLSFTAEEAWQHLPAVLQRGRASVFDLPLPHGSARGSHEKDQIELWDLLKRMRASVAAAEGMRDFQLQAQVAASLELEHKLRALGDNLREALVVSAVRLEADPQALSGADPEIVLSPAEGGKCQRCWKYLPLGSDPLHPTLCEPCASLVRTLEAPKTLS